MKGHYRSTVCCNVAADPVPSDQLPKSAATAATMAVLLRIPDERFRSRPGSDWRGRAAEPRATERLWEQLGLPPRLSAGGADMRACRTSGERLSRFVRPSMG